jgi:hypothetical protein
MTSYAKAATSAPQTAPGHFTSVFGTQRYKLENIRKMNSPGTSLDTTAHNGVS